MRKRRTSLPPEALRPSPHTNVARYRSILLRNKAGREPTNVDFKPTLIWRTTRFRRIIPARRSTHASASYSSGKRCFFDIIPENETRRRHRYVSFSSSLPQRSRVNRVTPNNYLRYSTRHYLLLGSRNGENIRCKYNSTRIVKTKITPKPRQLIFKRTMWKNWRRWTNGPRFTILPT